MTGFRGCLTAALIAVAGAGVAVASVAQAGAGAAPAETLRPARSLPSVAAEPGGQYYILLLKWSRDVTIGPVTARVTYLDPPLYLAWLRQATPDIDQAGFERQFSDFPDVLRFRVAYQAAERKAIRARDWTLRLHLPGGGDITATDGRRIAPVDLKSGANGDFWEDDWDYRVAVPRGFLAADPAGLTVSLSGPAGEGRAVWSFGAVATVAAAGDGYVPYLGTILSLLSVALLVALVLTRPPPASVS